MSIYTKDREILKVGNFGIWMASKEDGSGSSRCLVDEFENESDAIAEANRLNEKEIEWTTRCNVTRHFYVVIIND